MSTKGKSKSTNWLSVAKCVTIPFRKWNEYPRRTGGISHVDFDCTKPIRQLTSYDESLFETEVCQTTIEEVPHGG